MSSEKLSVPVTPQHNQIKHISCLRFLRRQARHLEKQFRENAETTNRAMCRFDTSNSDFLRAITDTPDKPPPLFFELKKLQRFLRDRTAATSVRSPSSQPRSTK